MRNKLVAALACRAGGSRLYGKPLQNIDIKNQITILDHIIHGMKACNFIDEIVLGISEGVENQIFIDYAHKHKISYIMGDQKDVLSRLIMCGRIGRATDVFRVTSECPFIAWELIEQAWLNHKTNRNDVTVTDYMPEGVNFEIYTLDALQKSHDLGGEYERSEFCSAYVRRNPSQFKIEIIKPSKELMRLDLRLTVDYPEDLILCRKIYEKFKASCPYIPLSKIFKYIDDNEGIDAIVKQFVDQTPIWASVIQTG